MLPVSEVLQLRKFASVKIWKKCCLNHSSETCAQICNSLLFWFVKYLINKNGILERLSTFESLAEIYLHANRSISVPRERAFSVDYLQDHLKYHEIVCGLKKYSIS